MEPGVKRVPIQVTRCPGSDSVRDRVGKRGVSPYVEAAVRRRTERDDLQAMIQANEEIHGSLTPEEVQAAREEIYGAVSRGEVA